MLAADKILLESTIRQSATSLKEKEFMLHHNNLSTVGTQAAVMAGFTVTALIEFGPPAGSNRILKFLYYNVVVLSLTSNILCVVKTTCLSVMGTSLATRGPDGSVVRAVNGIYKLREQIFALFAVGMLSLLVMAILGSWLLLDGAQAVVATLVLLSALAYTFRSYETISAAFFFDESDAVSFDDILNSFKAWRRDNHPTESLSGSLAHRGEGRNNQAWPPGATRAGTNNETQDPAAAAAEDRLLGGTADHHRNNNDSTRQQTDDDAALTTLGALPSTPQRRHAALHNNNNNNKSLGVDDGQGHLRAGGAARVHFEDGAVARSLSAS